MPDNRGLLSKVWDQVNMGDSGRTFKNPTPNANKVTTAAPSGPDPNKVAGVINGRPYNFAGDWLGGGTSSVVEDPGLALLKAQNAELSRQLSATPRLAKFDVMSNWNNAKSAAERAVNPLYEKKLNDFLEQNQAKSVRKTNEFNMNLENITNEKANTLAENAVGRTRTAEDTALAIEGINTKEGQFQTDEGQSFDQNYRAAAEELAASGAATTGMGKQQTSDMIRLRNVSSQRQLDEFQGQRQAKELFKTRTFEDLARGDATAAQLAESKQKAAQFDLDAYLEDLAFDEKNTRFDNEIARQSAVYENAQQQEKIGVEQFLAGLTGAGYGAKDIAYNRSVYA